MGKLINFETYRKYGSQRYFLNSDLHTLLPGMPQNVDGQVAGVYTYCTHEPHGWFVGIFLCRKKRYIREVAL